MYECRWFVLCETVIHDARSNNLTMVNALTQLRTPNFPALNPRFAFAAVLEREGESEGSLSLRFVRETESGEEILFIANGTGQAPARAQFFLNFPMGIRLFGEGSVTFRIEAREGEADWYSVGSQSIQVSTLEGQSAAPLGEKADSRDKPSSNIE
jgi:hypothetical protein